MAAIHGQANASLAAGYGFTGILVAFLARQNLLAVVPAAFRPGSVALSYPGSWNEGLSSGQGLMAVALVIFARWNSPRCVLAALLFGAAGALGPSLQSTGISYGYHFFNAAPVILTLAIMAGSVRSKPAAQEASRELSIVK